MPKLVNNEALTGFTDFFRFSVKDILTTGFLSTIGAANQKVIASVPAGGIITRAAVFEVVDATGTGTMTLDVGTTGTDPDECIDATNLKTLTKVVFGGGDSIPTVNNTTAAVPVYMEFNSDTFTAAGLATGEWVIALEIIDPGRLTK